MNDDARDPTPEEHRARHVLLHRMLDELLADYLIETRGRPSTTTVMDLLAWSWSQVSGELAGEHRPFDKVDFQTREGLEHLRALVDVIPPPLQDVLRQGIEEILRLHAELDERRR